MTICLYCPTCPCYSPDATTCQTGGGSYCGRWRIFDSITKKRVAKEQSRIATNQKINRMCESLLYLGMTFFCAWMIQFAADYHLIVMLFVIYSGTMLRFFIESIGEWS